MRHIVIYTLTALPPMTKRPTKIDRLREMGMLNPQPERVRAPWFEVAGFFDANDLLQVKYEMLRHARQGGVTKAEAAELFGVSRPTFYQAEAAFDQAGLAGLLPRPGCPAPAPHSPSARPPRQACARCARPAMPATGAPWPDQCPH